MIKYPNGLEVHRVGIKHPSKFNNQIHEVDGYKFDSTAELRYYYQLKTLKLNFKVHEKFEILEAFTCNKKHYAHRTYTPDFSVYDDNGVLKEVIDVKGGKATLTTDSSLRMAMFMFRHKVPVLIATYDSKTKTFTEKLK